MNLTRETIMRIDLTNKEAGEILSFLDHLPSGKVHESTVVVELYNKLCEKLKTQINAKP